ncbi:MAG TPA: energy transducer TonB [Tahibacter sp.]|uniref:energy transducer TonB n=1 Tax=Tahibacter sp. TaxID=2056211 RepID=UPI002C9D0B2F|nr:energy transducer TonB [Tahibacter sp.]HSX59503.1 energy transducer TonB [Tahibacter sp.]
MSTLVLTRGFQWKRSSAIGATLALHGLAALAMLAPPAYVAIQRIQDKPVQAVTIKREEPPPPPPPVLKVEPFKPKTPPVRPVASPKPEPVRADPVVTDVPTLQSYPAVSEPGPVAPPAGPVETAPSALGYKSMKQVPYPAIAKRQRLEGTVLLRVLVGPDGVPQRIDIERSSGHNVLDRAAKEAVMTWRFEPGTRNGEPFAAYGLVPIAFRLTEL